MTTTIKMTRNMKLALAALRNGAESAEDVAFDTDQRSDNARRTLRTLCDAGLVRYVGAGIFITVEIEAAVKQRKAKGYSLTASIRELAVEKMRAGWAKSEFVAAAVENGFNKNTASTQWHCARELV